MPSVARWQNSPPYFINIADRKPVGSKRKMAVRHGIYVTMAKKLPYLECLEFNLSMSSLVNFALACLFFNCTSSTKLITWLSLNFLISWQNTWFCGLINFTLLAKVGPRWGIPGVLPLHGTACPTCSATAAGWWLLRPWWRCRQPWWPRPKKCEQAHHLPRLQLKTGKHCI